MDSDGVMIYMSACCLLAARAWGVKKPLSSPSVASHAIRRIRHATGIDRGLYEAACAQAQYRERAVLNN